MKKTVSLCIAVMIAVCFTACSKAESASTKEVVTGFFAAFENSDYETMKEFCTKECIDTYFHEDDVDGMRWAKAIKIDDVYDKKSMEEHMYTFHVNVEMETVQNSAQFGQKQASFFVLLKQDEEGSWKINSFLTGL